MGSKLAMITQLKVWSTQIDDLVASYLAAGAQYHDPYRIRIDDLRAQQGAMQTKLNKFNSSRDGRWETFQTAIADEWNVLETGFEDLKH